jgi:dUTP pyrophosphatase
VNVSRERATVAPGDRIAQLVIAPVTHAELAELAEVDELPTTTRGDGGFGSTGVR